MVAGAKPNRADDSWFDDSRHLRLLFDIKRKSVYNNETDTEINMVLLKLHKMSPTGARLFHFALQLLVESNNLKIRRTCCTLCNVVVGKIRAQYIVRRNVEN